VPAQILYDAFHGRYHSGAGAIILLFIIWGSFFFGGLSITTSAARVVSGCHFHIYIYIHTHTHMVIICTRNGRYFGGMRVHCLA
jgi:hypothetical protein